MRLCWYSANYDPKAFETPSLLDLRRSPNPHVAFGSEYHSCLEAHRARAILRSLLKHLAQGIRAVTVVDAVANVERQSSFSRVVGYRRLVCSLTALLLMIDALPLFCQAIVANGVGGFALSEIALAAPRGREVAMRMEAAELCHTDVDAIRSWEDRSSLVARGPASSRRWGGT